jgi:hypothetical protein
MIRRKESLTRPWLHLETPTTLAGEGNPLLISASHRGDDVIDPIPHELVIVDLGRGQIVQHYAEIDYFCEKQMKPARDR